MLVAHIVDIVCSEWSTPELVPLSPGLLMVVGILTEVGMMSGIGADMAETEGTNTLAALVSLLLHQQASQQAMIISPANYMLPMCANHAVVHQYFSHAQHLPDKVVQGIAFSPRHCILNKVQ